MRKDCLLGMFVQFDKLMFLVWKVISGIREILVHMSEFSDRIEKLWKFEWYCIDWSINCAKGGVQSPCHGGTCCGGNLSDCVLDSNEKDMERGQHGCELAAMSFQCIAWNLPEDLGRNS